MKVSALIPAEGQCKFVSIKVIKVHSNPSNVSNKAVIKTECTYFPLQKYKCTKKDTSCSGPQKTNQKLILGAA
jgi:hypothetical protein